MKSPTVSESIEISEYVKVYISHPSEAPDDVDVYVAETNDLPQGNSFYYEVSLDSLGDKVGKRYIHYEGPLGRGTFDTYRKEIDIHPKGPDGEEIKNEIFKQAKGILEKYKIYISDASSLQEAESMAPEWADVQESESGAYYYEKLPGQGAGGVDLTSEQWQSDYMSIDKAQDLRKQWVDEDMSWDDVDSLLFNAHRNVVWWEPDDTDDLSKAPDMWRSDDYVPEFVKEFIREVVKGGVIYDTFDGLPHTAALKMQEIFEEELTQSAGWSIDSIVNEIEKAFKGIGHQQALAIARTEAGVILNSAREEAYKARPDSEEYEYYWSNPVDHRTTDLCKEVIEEIEKRGGALPLPELKELLYQKAKEYADDYGTPNRAKDFFPHFECRSTFVREVYL